MGKPVHPDFYQFMRRILADFPAAIPRSESLGLLPINTLIVCAGVRMYLTDLAARPSQTGGIQ